MLNPSGGRQWINPSKRLVDKAIDRWVSNNLRADNTSVVTGMSQDYVMSLLKSTCFVVRNVLLGI